jgi:hypothetical protein
MLRPMLAAAVVLGAEMAPRGASANDEQNATAAMIAPARGEPRSFVPRADELASMLVDVSTRCRSSAERAWRGGQSAQACVVDTMRAGRRRLRRHPSHFGVVVHRHVDLVGARLVLAQASSCREWPTPRRDRVLSEFDALAAGCHLRPYRGPLQLVLLDGKGRRVGAVPVRADREGVVAIRFADIDAAARDRGLGSLDRYGAIAVGHDGWGGRFDLGRLRGFLADWHWSWVRRGRGSPALFALRHGAHPRAELALDLAIEANLARQQRDFVSVERGILPPATFLDRYVVSPMRHSVESMLAEFRTSTSSMRATP